MTTIKHVPNQQSNKTARNTKSCIISIVSAKEFKKMRIIATKKFSQYSCKIDNSRPYFLTKPKKNLLCGCVTFYLPLKIEETVAFAKLVETTGIVALAVHGR